MDWELKTQRSFSGRRGARVWAEKLSDFDSYTSNP